MITEAEIKCYKDKCHSIANLQLLGSLQNQLKTDRHFDEWVESTYTPDADKATYFSRHFIPTSESLPIKNFLNFLKAREKLIRKAIAETFPSAFSKLVTAYGLKDKI